MKNSIQKSATYAFPINQVWEAIAKAEEITKWFIKADFKAEVGYKGTFTHEDTVIKIVVLEVAQPTKLVYTWHVVGFESEPTTVMWELSELDGVTTVTVTHSDLEKLGDMQKTMSEKFAGGWENCLSELGKYLGK